MDLVDRVSAAKDIKSDSSSFNALISAKLPKAQHMHTSALINVVCRHDIFLKTGLMFTESAYGYALYIVGLCVRSVCNRHSETTRGGFRVRGRLELRYCMSILSFFWPMCLVQTGLPLS